MRGNIFLAECDYNEDIAVKKEEAYEDGFNDGFEDSAEKNKMENARALIIKKTFLSRGDCRLAQPIYRATSGFEKRVY